jgi:hypothetical protein
VRLPLESLIAPTKAFLPFARIDLISQQAQNGISRGFGSERSAPTIGEFAKFPNEID